MNKYFVFRNGRIVGGFRTIDAAQDWANELRVTKGGDIEILDESDDWT